MNKSDDITTVLSRKLVLVRTEGNAPFVYFEGNIFCENNSDWMKKEIEEFLRLYEASNKAETGSDGNDYGMTWYTFEV